MEQLSLPTQIELIKDKDPHKATLVIAPCHPGYGTTIGNALRRVLLSSLPGAAVVAVKIEGVEHEFTTIPNVKEDVVQVLLNLKQLRLRVFSNEIIRLSLSASGEKKVTAKEITPNADVEIITPDLHIAELTAEDADLKMEIFVRRGRGYVPIEEREDEKKEIGVIAIDSVFTPMRSVGYRVEDMRVGQKINYDKLTMSIETDGTIDPADTVRQATKILMDHFSLLADVEMGGPKKLSKKQTESDGVSDSAGQDTEGRPEEALPAEDTEQGATAGEVTAVADDGDEKAEDGK